jgi:hypothetical protein
MFFILVVFVIDLAVALWINSVRGRTRRLPRWRE